MANPPDKTRVKAGNISIPLYRHAQGWRWAWKDPLAAFLAEERARRTNEPDDTPVCQGHPPSRDLPVINRAVTTILGEAVGGWKANALRHSFISYRAVQIGLSRTALEAGNSEAEARRSYHDAMTEADALAWFSPFGTSSELRIHPDDDAKSKIVPMP